MKVLQLVSSKNVYGAENVVLNLSTALKEYKCDVHLVNLADTSKESREIIIRAQDAGINTGEIPCFGRFDITAVKAVSDYVTSNSFDVVHCHGYKPNFYALLSGVKGSARLVTTCHNWPAVNAKMCIYRSLDKIMIRRFGKVAVVSEQLKNEAIRAGVSPEKIVKINNGINLSLFKARPAEALNALKKKFNIPAAVKVICTVGRLSPEKGHRYFIEAAKKITARYSGAIFLIAGDGPLKETLLQSAMPMSVENKFIFLGNRKDVNDIIALTDIFVLPSLVEGMPVALLEAMGAGKAIVASSVGEVPHIIHDNFSGFVVKPGDSSSLADAILQLLKNPLKREFFGANAFKKASEEFSSETMAKQYLDIYSSLL